MIRNQQEYEDSLQKMWAAEALYGQLNMRLKSNEIYIKCLLSEIKKWESRAPEALQGAERDEVN